MATEIYQLEHPTGTVETVVPGVFVGDLVNPNLEKEYPFVTQIREAVDFAVSELFDIREDIVDLEVYDLKLLFKDPTEMDPYELDRVEEVREIYRNLQRLSPTELDHTDLKHLYEYYHASYMRCGQVCSDAHKYLKHHAAGQYTFKFLKTARNSDLRYFGNDHVILLATHTQSGNIVGFSPTNIFNPMTDKADQLQPSIATKEGAPITFNRARQILISKSETDLIAAINVLEGNHDGKWADFKDKTTDPE